MNVPDTLILELWELIRPIQPELAFKLLLALRKLFNTPREKWFWYPFLRAKKTPGLYRRIVPANHTLAVVHKYIAEWLIAIVPQGFDYGSRGMGALPAVLRHQGALSGMSIDLKSAYDYVSAQKLLEAFKNRFPDTNIEVLKLLTYILTYDGSTPQGGIATGPAFNLVISQTDERWVRLASKYPTFAITRYIDDLLITFRVPGTRIDFGTLDKQIRNIALIGGFEVKKTNVFLTEPFDYLGIRIYKDMLELSKDQTQKVLGLLNEALKSPVPILYKNKVGHSLGWVKQVFKNNKDISPNNALILTAYKSYYDRLGDAPSSLSELLNYKF